MEGGSGVGWGGGGSGDDCSDIEEIKETSSSCRRRATCFVECGFLKVEDEEEEKEDEKNEGLFFHRRGFVI